MLLAIDIGNTNVKIGVFGVFKFYRVAKTYLISSECLILSLFCLLERKF